MVQHLVDQFRQLLVAINPQHLGRADYLNLLTLAQGIPMSDDSESVA